MKARPHGKFTSVMNRNIANEFIATDLCRAIRQSRAYGDVGLLWQSSGGDAVVAVLYLTPGQVTEWRRCEEGSLEDWRRAAEHVEQVADCHVSHLISRDVFMNNVGDLRMVLDSITLNTFSESKPRMHANVVNKLIAIVQHFPGLPPVQRALFIHNLQASIGRSS